MRVLGNECFEVESCFTNFYSGNTVVWAVDGQHLYCQKYNVIDIIAVATGRKVGCVNLNDGSTNEIDNLLTFDVSKEDVLITAHTSGLLKLWNLGNFLQIKKWKSHHLGHILTLRFSPCGKILVSVGADFKVRVWDLKNCCCICNIREEGIISTINFYPDILTSNLFVAGYDNVIRCWNYYSKKHLNSFKGHISHITAIAFDERMLMASVSVDKVLILWNIIESSQLKVIPLYESLHGVLFFTNNQIRIPGNRFNNDEQTFVIATGITGSIYLINCSDYNVIYTQHNTHVDTKKPLPCIVTHLLQCKKIEQFAIVKSNHSISFYDVSSFKCIKQLIGFNGDILDMCFLGDNSQYLALATNNTTINIYELSTMNCVIASAHMDRVLTITSFKNYLLSAGRDMIILIWKLDPDLFSIRCIGKCMGHTSAIVSICSSNYYLPTFASVSEDGILKLWIAPQLSVAKSETMYEFSLKKSAKAHDKEVNCVAFSPNNVFIATASQDKTIKVWKSQDLRVMATLRGHQRGVWRVRFSPINQILISSSNDCSIRIWSLSTMECLSKIEEKCSVLRLEFLAQGNLFITADTVGVIKIWNFKSTKSLLTLDEHKNQVWAIAVAKDGSGFYSGGSDSNLTFWKNVTKKNIKEHIDQNVIINRQYEIFNDLNKDKQIEEVFRLGLMLKKPRSSLKIIRNVVKKKSSFCLNSSCLPGDEINNLQTHVRTWNTNARFCKVSQFILATVIDEIVIGRTRICSHNILVKYINPYTERHYKRICFYVKQLSFLDFLVNCM